MYQFLFFEKCIYAPICIVIAISLFYNGLHVGAGMPKSFNHQGFFFFYDNNVTDPEQKALNAKFYLVEMIFVYETVCTSRAIALSSS